MKTKLKNIRNFLVCLLLIPSLTLAKQIHSPIKLLPQTYISMSLGYIRNIVNGNSHRIDTTLPPGSPSYLTAYNFTGADAPILQVGGGYFYPLTPHWGWSLGGRLSSATLEQDGKEEISQLPNVFSSYNYNISATIVSAVTRLSYKINLWQYYGELNVGVVRLNSDNFFISGTPEFYTSKTVWNRSYGVSLGVVRYFNRHTSIGFSANILDMGNATLGEIRAEPPIPDSGIKQHLRTTILTLTVTHWF